jgi:hypothetical protein
MKGLPGIKREDFAFTVTDPLDQEWDAYYFVKDGKDGTLAFRKDGTRWVIGVLCAGRLTEQQVLEKLLEAKA